MFSPILSGNLTTAYSAQHYGIDIGFQGIVNPPIRAIRKGIVYASAFGTGAGNTIVLRHDINSYWTMVTRYCHLSKRLVFTGDQVDEGQIIGTGGNTGTLSTGPHLHLETLIMPISKLVGYFQLDWRPLYAFDPRGIISTNTIKGEGLHMITYKPVSLPTARPTTPDLRFRIAPSLTGKIMGVVKVADHPYLGATDPITEIVNGKPVTIQWAKLAIEDLIVYASLEYLQITEPKIREPLHAILTDGKLKVTVDTI
jgi:murein DD-endopeptidase MepM/ murein hydrolase activator NlpD